MTELKLYIAESNYLNERYQLFAESEDEAYNLLIEHFKQMDYYDPENIEVQFIDYYEIEKGIIRFYS